MPVDTTILAADGVVLGGTVYHPVGANPPGLILLHGLGSDRDAWAGFAGRAQRAGILCVAIDFRGHGESTDGGALSHRTFGEEDWAGLLLDVAAAHQALLEAGADPNHVAIAGSALGGNAGLAYGHVERSIQTVVMVSPGLDYLGYETAPLMVAMAERPVLMMTSEGDSYSLQSAQTLKSLSPGYSELRTYPGTAHGTDLLAGSESANVQIIQWLEGIIGEVP